MSFDVVVIGAGSAGAVIAARLSEVPDLSVALIEAGPDYPDPAALPDELRYGNATAAYVTTHGHMWGYRARVARGQEPRALPRGKVVGGTSAINGQVFLRGLRDDFRAWSGFGNDLWSYDLLLPSMRAIEHDLDFADPWHGTSGPIQVRRYPPEEWMSPQTAFYEACRQDFTDCPDANAPDATGVGPIPFNNVGGIRASTALTYLPAARARPNFTLLPDTHATRLVFTGNRATAVEVERAGHVETVTAGQIVLAAGVIGSPQLLMLSGVGDPDELARLGIPPVAKLPGVGRGLADHQIADLVWEVAPEVVKAGESAPRVQVALRYTAEGSPDPDDMQITVRTAAPGHHGDSLVSLVPAIELPHSTGSVTLTSTDPADQPAIELNFLDDPRDLARLREAVRLTVDISRRAPMAALLGRRTTLTDRELLSDASVDGWLKASVRTSHHTGGTCRMGPAVDPAAVVDQLGRVHGVENLRVADASVFPRMVRANTAVTTMTVAERIAELMKQELGTGAAA